MKIDKVIINKKDEVWKFPDDASNKLLIEAAKVKGNEAGWLVITGEGTSKKGKLYDISLSKTEVIKQVMGKGHIPIKCAPIKSRLIKCKPIKSKSFK